MGKNQDPGSGINIRDKHPGSATLFTCQVIRITCCAGEDASVEYFLKVISLLEQFPCPDLVIYMAETALAICPQDHKVTTRQRPPPPRLLAPRRQVEIMLKVGTVLPN
jgi:hypothetical protein